MSNKIELISTLQEHSIALTIEENYDSYFHSIGKCDIGCVLCIQESLPSICSNCSGTGIIMYGSSIVEMVLSPTKKPTYLPIQCSDCGGNGRIMDKNPIKYPQEYIDHLLKHKSFKIGYDILDCGYCYELLLVQLSIWKDKIRGFSTICWEEVSKDLAIEEYERAT